VRAEARLLLVGEAPGYRGARVSGVPFTSERQLTGSGPAEATATVVHRVLSRLGIEEDVLLWNVVPTHPGTATSNRIPTAEEIRAGSRFVGLLCEGTPVVAVGRLAECALGVDAVRHPAHGGAEEFEAGLAALASELLGVGGHRSVVALPARSLTVPPDVDQAKFEAALPVVPPVGVSVMVRSTLFVAGTESDSV